MRQQKKPITMVLYTISLHCFDPLNLYFSFVLVPSSYYYHFNCTQVTAYTYPSAVHVDAAGIDILLVVCNDHLYATLPICASMPTYIQSTYINRVIHWQWLNLVTIRPYQSRMILFCSSDHQFIIWSMVCMVWYT
jgi:hypothetical protein